MAVYVWLAILCLALTLGVLMGLIASLRSLTKGHDKPRPIPLPVLAVKNTGWIGQHFDNSVPPKPWQPSRSPKLPIARRPKIAGGVATFSDGTRYKVLRTGWRKQDD